MKLKKSQKRVLIRIILAAVLLVLCRVLIGGHSHFGESHGHIHAPEWVAALCYLVPYFIIGYDILWKAVRGIFHGQVFDENFLMAVATVGVLSIGLFPDHEPEYMEAVMVMLLYQTGELFQSIAVGKSRSAIASLMEICPDTANVEREGKIEEVAPDEVAVGEIIVIKPGEKIPLDGTVTEGQSSLNTVALTGESNPRDVAVGDAVISGCINMNGVLRVRVDKEFGESTVSKILELVETSGDKKSKSEAYITRFARWYTPVVVCSAAALAVIPPVIMGLISGFDTAPFSEWILRAINFLIISCPCALVISVPMSFFGGIGGASRKGILIKGSSYLEALAHAETVVYDKTGTLTKGNFKVTAIHPEKIDEHALLDLAATAESYSDHPISRSLKQAYAKEVDNSRVGEVREIAGHGIKAMIDGKQVCVGNRKFMRSIGAQWHECDAVGTVVHVAVDGEYEGHIIVSDEIKPDAKEGIARLGKLGVKKTVMLTGDAAATGRAVGEQLGVDEVHSELMPDGKVEKLEQILAQKSAKGKVVYVGDGINDAPVLARGDIGIAMGALGSDAAIEAADVVLMDDSPSKVATAIQISRRTLRIVRQNIVFAIGVKLVVLILSLLPFIGTLPPIVAIFADVGVMILAVLNAMRALYVPKK